MEDQQQENHFVIFYSKIMKAKKVYLYKYRIKIMRIFYDIQDMLYKKFVKMTKCYCMLKRLLHN